MNIVLYIAVAMAAGCAGTSIGLGFWPRYPQPKNLRIQLALGIIGIASLTYIVLTQLDKLK